MAGAADPKPEQQSIQVAVRIRPLNSREQEAKEAAVVAAKEGGTVEVRTWRDQEPKCFTFDNVYGMDADQDRVHTDLGQLLLRNSVDGYNSCLFAYGQTGAGKSWSITGDQKTKSRWGLLPRICEGLFECLSKRESSEKFRIACTYLEIYNEKMKDLLSQTPATLEVHKHPTLGICVPNLSETAVETYEDVQTLLESGNALRSVSATAMNEQSSRSHAVFTLNITQTLTDKTEVRARLNIVDLAGSERQKKTRAEGARLKEGAKINQSLTVLGQVIFALAGRHSGDQKGMQQHVPFRNSKLTFLLSDSLSGNSKTVMIAAVSPAASSFEETLNTLRFAQSVKKVKTQVVKNEAKEEDCKAVIQQLRLEMENLKMQLAASANALLDQPSPGTDNNELSVGIRKSVQVPTMLASTQEEAAGSDRMQQLHDDKLIEAVERNVARRGCHKETESMKSIAARFAQLRDDAEQANYIMSWMMEHNFMPKSGSGQARWLASIKWHISEDSPNLLGTLQAQLVETAMNGSETVNQSFDEEDFRTIVSRLEEQCDECTRQLNQPNCSHHHGDPKADATPRGAAPEVAAAPEAALTAIPAAPAAAVQAASSRGGSSVAAHDCPPPVAGRKEVLMAKGGKRLGSAGGGAAHKEAAPSPAGPPAAKAAAVAAAGEAQKLCGESEPVSDEVERLRDESQRLRSEAANSRCRLQEAQEVHKRELEAMKKELAACKQATAEHHRAAVVEPPAHSGKTAKSSASARTGYPNRLAPSAKMAGRASSHSGTRGTVGAARHPFAASPCASPQARGGSVAVAKGPTSHSAATMAMLPDAREGATSPRPTCQRCSALQEENSRLRTELSMEKAKIPPVLDTE